MSESTVSTADDATSPTLVQKLSAEVLGTLILVFLGCGAVVASSISLGGDAGGPAFIGTVGLTFGLAIVISVYAFGRISGGHFNPAVSAGAAIAGRIPWIEAVYYWVAQVVGAIIGAFLLWIVVHGFEGYKSTEMGLGQNSFGDDANGYAWWGALIIEIIMTAIFVTVIMAVTDTRNEHPALAPLAIGLALAAIHFLGITFTGTSVNPARSIGPALFSGADALKDLWLFIVAPLIGGVAAGAAYPMLFGRAEPAVVGSGLNFGTRVAAAPDQLQQEWNQQQNWGQQGYAPQPGQQQFQQYQQPQAQQPQQPQAQSWTEEEDGRTVIKGEGGQHPTSPMPPTEQPVIIQDGWQWDYAAQQWKPVDQPPQS